MIALELLQEQLRLPYQRSEWIPLLQSFFPALEIFAQPVDFPLTNEQELSTATARRQIGNSTLADGKRIAFFEVDVVPNVDLLRNRVALRRLTSRCIDEFNAHAVIGFFVQPGTDTFRLTYAARESTLNSETLAVETKETAARRFTYILGPSETCRTAAVRLSALSAKGSSLALKDVTDAFSVEKLSKEFFTAYKLHYTAFCDHLLSSDAPIRIFGLTLSGLEGKALDRALKPVRDFVKKLLGRLVFLHFLQRKGWLGCDANRKEWKGGLPDFLGHLFDSTPAAEKERFHSTRLVPLFFDTLNNPHRKRDVFPVTGTRVPYLNGGLFERDFQGVEMVEFPAPLFAALLEFFGQYHFTIDENDPDDHEIGIDPEMLGHIFENLLEDNKDKGAYYTPKAVVQYMCQQSLIHALAGHFPEDPDAKREIESLIRTKEPLDIRNQKNWLVAHARQIETLLDDLRICDPAIGSGAFPIGLLQEIYWTKLTLHPALDRAKAKRDIIQKSIHGVDLDAGAVEIARLRFWLALIVEEEAPVPLPNLDYQIMQGNSLLESFDGMPLDKLDAPVSTFGLKVFGSDQHEFNMDASPQVELHHFTTPARQELGELRNRYFACHDPEAKAGLRRDIDSAVLRAIDEEISRRRAELQSTIQNWDVEMTNRAKNAKLAKRAKAFEIPVKEQQKRDAWVADLAKLDERQSRLHSLLENPRAERPFFLWHLWFRHVLAEPPEGRGGFDIVIANPPYVRQEAIKDLKPQLKAEPYECYDGVADLLVYFYECAVKKLRPGGAIAFITSNKFYRAGYGETLRAFLARELMLHRLIDFGDAPVFEAIAYASILEGSRTAVPTDSTALVYTWETGMPLDSIEQVVARRSQLIHQSELTPESWRLESLSVIKLLSKLRQNGKPLGEYVGGRIYRGILTGLNEAFVVDRTTRDRLIAEHSSSANILKPFLRGKDAKRWSVEFAERYLIKIESSVNATHPWSGKKDKDAEDTFAETYPAIHRWLSQFREGLLNRDDQGAHFWELRSCSYWNEFLLPKLIVPAISGAVNVALDTDGFFSNNKTSIFICEDASFVSAIVNSKVGFWFARQVFATKQGGFFDFEPRYSSQWPIPPATPTDQAILTALVDRILAAKRAGDETAVTELEAEIDAHVFRLYGLTEEEIRLIQGQK